MQTTPERAFTHNLNQEQAAQPIWPYFVLAALLLLPFDVAIRRLVITHTDLEKVREAVAMRRSAARRSNFPESHRRASNG